MSWKERLFRSLPFALVLVAATGIAVTEEIYYAIVALAGVWLLPSPLSAVPNVSRETSLTDKLHFVCAECLSERDPKNVSRETSNERPEPTDLPVPCTLMHGSAEDHVLGCEGWTFPR